MSAGPRPLDASELETRNINAPNSALHVRVRSITYVAEDINAYEVVDPAGDDLPNFDAGAHLDLYFRDGRVRQYSLCGDPADRKRYTFAVQREENGRGGSRAIFEMVRTGRMLAISAPRNNFPLDESARHHVLLGGGVGITPLVAMMRRLASIHASFELHYSVRTASKIAFEAELRSLAGTRTVAIYVDGGDPNKGIPLAQTLARQAAGTHVYCCGPAGMIDSARAASSHLGPAAFHFERFSAPGDASAAHSGPTAADQSIRSDAMNDFEVRLARSARSFRVPANQSIVDVLRDNGIVVLTSCEAGVCGTCRVRVLEGTPDHRDYLLDHNERRNEMLICCSRSRSATLVLDL